MRNPALLSANKRGTDQPTHPCTLISTLQFAILLVSLCKMSSKDQLNV